MSIACLSAAVKRVASLVFDERRKGTFVLHVSLWLMESHYRGSNTILALVNLL